MRVTEGRQAECQEAATCQPLSSRMRPHNSANLASATHQHTASLLLPPLQLQEGAQLGDLLQHRPPAGAALGVAHFRRPVEVPHLRWRVDGLRVMRPGCRA